MCRNCVNEICQNKCVLEQVKLTRSIPAVEPKDNHCSKEKKGEKK